MQTHAFALLFGPRNEFCQPQRLAAQEQLLPPLLSERRCEGIYRGQRKEAGTKETPLLSLFYKKNPELIEHVLGEQKDDRLTD